MIHKGFYDSWRSLRAQTIIVLNELGCNNKPIRMTGHSLGAAIATIAAFELLAEGYRVKHVYTFGQPRIGNEAWVKAFEERMAPIPYFRVVEFKDPVPHLPPRECPKGAKLEECPMAVFQNGSSVEKIFREGLPQIAGIEPLMLQRETGFRHVGPEVFYTETKMGYYNVCRSGEDHTCSSQFNLVSCLTHGCCHCSYLGMNPCDAGTSAPECSQTQGTKLKSWFDGLSNLSVAIFEKLV